VKLPDHDESFTTEGEMTDMAIYFNRPPQYQHLKYTEFHRIYIYDTKLRAHAEISGTFEEIRVPGVNKTIFITKRCNEDANLVRMEMLYPSAGEIWYLRVILQNRPCSSYIDARTCNGVIYSSFQLSAMAHQYVDTEKETSLCFEEAIGSCTPSELRYLLCSLTLQGFPTLHIFHTCQVNDICFITRNLSKRYGLANNTRVRILEISPMKSVIRVQTLGTNAKAAIIPRIRFKFRLPFEMTRVQFPLRLAYCMTYNKSQGQTLQKVLLDVSVPPFAHGHLIVALSRVTNYSDIKIICQEDQLYHQAPKIWNTLIC
jgi:hypothetical protein